MSNNISRRDVLKSLGKGVLAGSVLRVIPLEAAEYVHKMVASEKAASPGGAYIPKFFPAQQYKLLSTLCQTIIPADADSGGAIEAGSPEFIDLITSENLEYQLTLGGGLAWLDATSTDRYGQPYMGCAAEQQKQILDSIAYRKNALTDPTLSPGIEFFAFLRDLAVDGFFTSAVGIKYLQYIGNTYLAEFPGCPPVPEA
ncbi:MAG: gluconate 2-dehydrogenase subunit 3 family protein [Terriglobales bacterium]